MNKMVLLALLLLTACADMQTSKGSDGKAGTSASARIHSDLGAGYYQEKQFAIALDEFNESIKYDSNYAPAYNGLGLVYASLGEDTKADANFKKSLQLSPESSESRNNYGAFLCSRARFDESITQFLEAVKNPLYTTPHLAYLNAGVCALRGKDEKNAELYFGRALQIEPLLNKAAYELANIQFKRGQLLPARNTLQNALFANPTPEVLWLGVRIERILGDKNAESSYALQLKSKFPDSPQTQSLLSGN